MFEVEDGRGCRFQAQMWIQEIGPGVEVKHYNTRIPFWTENLSIVTSFYASFCFMKELEVQRILTFPYESISEIPEVSVSPVYVLENVNLHSSTKYGPAWTHAGLEREIS